MIRIWKPGLFYLIIKSNITAFIGEVAFHLRIIYIVATSKDNALYFMFKKLHTKDNKP